MNDLIYGVLVCAVLGVFIYFAADANERKECHQWQEQAAQFEGFYLVQWQADQCAAHDIQISAPVK